MIRTVQLYYIRRELLLLSNDTKVVPFSYLPTSSSLRFLDISTHLPSQQHPEIFASPWWYSLPRTPLSVINMADRKIVTTSSANSSAWRFPPDMDIAPTSPDEAERQELWRQMRVCDKEYKVDSDIFLAAGGHSNPVALEEFKAKNAAGEEILSMIGWKLRELDLRNIRKA
jgi:hypothetical protein